MDWSRYLSGVRGPFVAALVIGVISTVVVLLLLSSLDDVLQGHARSVRRAADSSRRFAE